LADFEVDVGKRNQLDLAADDIPGAALGPEKHIPHGFGARVGRRIGAQLLAGHQGPGQMDRGQLVEGLHDRQGGIVGREMGGYGGLGLVQHGRGQPRRGVRSLVAFHHPGLYDATGAQTGQMAFGQGDALGQQHRAVGPFQVRRQYHARYKGVQR